MKTKIFLKLSAVLMIIALCIASCAKSPVEDSGGDDTGNGGNGGDGGNDGGGGTVPSTEVMVQLKCTGEIPDMENQSAHLLYIQAYTLLEDDDEYYKMQPYAHGLFDNASNMTISLQKDRKYRFLATIVADGKNRIAFNDGVYGLPFNAQLTDNFVISGKFNPFIIMEGFADLAGYGRFSRPDIDRYYGESGVYTVNPENPVPANINIVRATFGLRVKVNNLTEGKLHIETDDMPRVSVSYPETEVSYIISAQFPNEAYYEDAEGKTEFTKNYTEDINVNITYENTEGLEIPVEQGYYTFRRNEYTNLEVTVSGSAVGSGFDINVEETEMEDDGQEVEFTGGGDYKKN